MSGGIPLSLGSGLYLKRSQKFDCAIIARVIIMRSIISGMILGKCMVEGQVKRISKLLESKSTKLRSNNKYHICSQLTCKLSVTIFCSIEQLLPKGLLVYRWLRATAFRWYIRVTLSDVQAVTLIVAIQAPSLEERFFGNFFV